MDLVDLTSEPDSPTGGIIPEFDVWGDSAGRWHGLHRGSRSGIGAETFEDLKRLACSHRIASTLRTAARSALRELMRDGATDPR